MSDASVVIFSTPLPPPLLRQRHTGAAVTALPSAPPGAHFGAPPPPPDPESGAAPFTQQRTDVVALHMPPPGRNDDEDEENKLSQEERVWHDAAQWREFQTRLRGLWATPLRRVAIATVLILIVLIAAWPRSETLPSEYMAARKGAPLRTVEAKIAYDGDPKRKSVPLSSLELDRGVLDHGVSLESLVSAMRIAMGESKYTGIAAAHLGVYVRVALVGDTVMVNPRITQTTPDAEVSNERSAFFRDRPPVAVRRALHVRVSYQRESGENYEVWLAAKEARLVQILVDVMDGLTAFDRAAAASK